MITCRRGPLFRAITSDLLAGADLHRTASQNGASKRAAKMRIYVHFSSQFLNINFQYWIYNLICAVFFSKFERLFKQNMYNSIIQSIAHIAQVFSHVSGNLWIPSQKNCTGFAAKNESSQFLISCSDVNRIPVRAFCIDRNKW